MSVVVEDGTVVAGANSFVEVADVRSFAAARGYAGLSLDDAVVEAQLVQATDYLNSFEDRYRGDRVSADQELSWPRANATVNGFDIEEDHIPALLKKAQMQLTIEIAKGFVPNISVAGGKFVKRQKVDVIEIEYATPSDMGGDATMETQIPSVMACLEPLFRGGSALRSVRV